MMYVILWFIPIILFWLILMGAPMLYLIIVYTWYPLLAGLISYKLVIGFDLGIKKWGLPIVLGFINSTVCYLTYGITNYLSMSKVGWSDRDNFISNAVVALIGVIVGLWRVHLEKNARKEITG